MRTPNNDHLSIPREFDASYPPMVSRHPYEAFHRSDIRSASQESPMPGSRPLNADVIHQRLGSFPAVCRSPRIHLKTSRTVGGSRLRSKENFISPPTTNAGQRQCRSPKARYAGVGVPAIQQELRPPTATRRGSGGVVCPPIIGTHGLHHRRAISKESRTHLFSHRTGRRRT